MTARKPHATLSLDLDNRWAYLKTRGIDGWDAFPSYLDLVVPRTLSFFERRGLTVTYFLVGQDAVLETNRAAFAALGRSPHDLANHSFHHDPSLQHQPATAIEAEIAMAGAAIREATGRTPIGFRGPSFSLSAGVLAALANLGYRYDASTFPTHIGPLARAYYGLRAGGTVKRRAARDRLFGNLTDGFRPLSPYFWRLPDDRRLLEMPVTTMPFLRLPIHLTYLVYLATFSPAAARGYFRAALGLCRMAGIEPSVLLHPLDFMGGNEAPDLAFFPGMSVDADTKLAWLEGFFDELEQRFTPISLERNALALLNEPGLRVLTPQFG